MEEGGPNTKRPLEACPAPLPPPSSGCPGAGPPLPGSLTLGAATLPTRSGRPEGTGRKGAADLTALSSGRGLGGGTGTHAGAETGRRARGCGPDSATPGPQLPAPRGQKVRPGDPGRYQSPAAARQAGRSPGHAPLPAFPEPPAAAPGPLGASSWAAPPPAAAGLRPLEPPPRPHLPLPPGSLPPARPQPRSHQHLPRVPGPRFRAPTASARGRHRRRPPGRPGPPGRGGAGSRERARDPAGAGRPRPSCGRPLAARTRRPPPLGAPLWGSARPPPQPPGRLERRAPPEISAVGGASLDAGRLPWPQLRPVSSVVLLDIPLLPSPPHHHHHQVTGGWGHPALELDYQGLSGKGTVEKDLKKI